MQDQVKTFHFWATMINVAIGGALEVELIPATGTLHKVALLIMIMLTAMGVRAAARWVSPATRILMDETPKDGMILPGETSR